MRHDWAGDNAGVDHMVRAISDICPDGTVTWIEEMGTDLSPASADPREVQIRIAANGQRIVVSVSGAPREVARALLLRLGFREQHLKRVLCG